jgi:hypothetical protein
METGKYGIKLWCYAVAAFIFGVLDLYLGILAVAAFAIIAEKNKWLNNQVIQALLLYLLYWLIILAINWTIGGLGKLFQLVTLYGAASVVGTITNVIKDIIFVAYLVFSVIAVIRCIMGKDGVFFLAKLSDKITTIKAKKEDEKEEKAGMQEVKTEKKKADTKEGEAGDKE